MSGRLQYSFSRLGPSTLVGWSGTITPKIEVNAISPKTGMQETKKAVFAHFFPFDVHKRRRLTRPSPARLHSNTFIFG